MIIRIFCGINWSYNGGGNLRSSFLISLFFLICLFLIRVRNFIVLMGLGFC